MAQQNHGDDYIGLSFGEMNPNFKFILVAEGTELPTSSENF